jgi:hypothetical protein
MACAVACEEEGRPGVIQPTGTGGDAGSGAGALGGAGGSVVPSGDPIKDFCDAVTRPFCEAYFACCTEPERLDQNGGSLEGCIAENRDCEARLKEPEDGLPAALAQGITVLDYDRLNACVARLRALAPGGDACIEPPKRAYYNCMSTFEGQVEAGEPCGLIDHDMSWIECKDGHCVDGACKPFLARGEACVNSDDATSFCNIGQWEWCIEDGSGPPTCGDPQHIGDTCVPWGDAQELGCRSDRCEDGECRTPTAAGMCVGGG